MEIKIICGQMEVIAGRPDLNYQKICKIIKEAQQCGADILLLPEMCVSGYFIGDLWKQRSFLDDCLHYNDEIIKASSDMCIIFGSVAVDEKKYNDDGSIRKYNAAYICRDGAALQGGLNEGFITKTPLSDYHGFEDSRHFFSLPQICAEKSISADPALQPVTVPTAKGSVKLGVLPGEDCLRENAFADPAKLLVKNGAELLINIYCSPFYLGKNQKRTEALSKKSSEINIPVICCGSVGVQNNGKNVFTFEGGSAAYTPAEGLLNSAEMFEECLFEVLYDFQQKNLRTSAIPKAQKTEPEQIYQALTYGAKKFLEQCGIKKITLGLSGGIDSAVAAALYAQILGPENVLLLNLPSRHNSQRAKNLAKELALRLKANYAVLPIEESCRRTIEQLTSAVIRRNEKESFSLELSELDKENIQARDRGARVVAAAAAAFGGAFSCNSNKTEITVGYATFYGDITGALAILGDLWKKQVYSLGHYINEAIFQREVIPEDIFSIRPSAELSAQQSIGTGGDPLVYEYHDCLFRAFVERNPEASPADILRWYADGSLAENIGCDPKIIAQTFANAAEFINDLERWWKLFAGFAAAKRIQAPPILSISQRTFGSGRKEAQLTPYFSGEYYLLKTHLLKAGNL